MNWSKSKTIFILLFLAIDLALLGYLAYDKASDRWISQSEVEQVSTYLENRKIHLDTELLPRWMPKVRNLEFVNILDLSSSFLKQFESETKELEHIGSHLELKKGEKALKISENYFEYQDMMERDYFLGSSSKTIHKLKPYFTELGFDIQEAEFQTIESNSELLVFQMTQAAEGLSIDDISVTITISSSGQLKIQGIWLNPVKTPSEYKKAIVRPITSTLIEFSRKAGHEATITEIAIRYRVDETKAYHKTFTAVAVWRIKTSDGECYYYNARL